MVSDLFIFFFYFCNAFMYQIIQVLQGLPGDWSFCNLQSTHNTLSTRIYPLKWKLKISWKSIWQKDKDILSDGGDEF